ncbi:MAG: hypothetical protein A2X56_12415 [Nitrospirae bacterium GWC2_57_13]|nr:MAG: hypothetical protein A2072_01570 [Nitrospirae bacterium GWC1_57_7]OGW26430.1 MAG: hypothetical protein A2X56_12415 [Nitrospirae bacterium GWC2_57_13]OGW46114.1 MAG: hypothetical protein A2X57_03830 [Nitrospirae bacterium GWD2_57_8]HAR45790.1 acetyl-CoA synthetase [Nitrospiraceae bacterium]HAS55237.1 acetyl-CoA synthetase [Nitrospiraceae bacterium]
MRSPSGIIRAALKQGRTHLLEHEAKELAHAAGIPVPDHVVVRANDDAALRAASRRLAFPLALKAVSQDILHKTDAGAVMLDILDERSLAAAASNIQRSVSQHLPGAKIEAFLLEKMMPPGLELLIGGLRDEQFGPSVAFGLGGVWVEALKDAAFGILPMTRDERLEMMHLTRAWTFLKGFRGSPPLDLETVLTIMDAMSRLLEQVPEIREIDLNPVRVYESGAVALDVRVVLNSR